MPPSLLRQSFNGFWGFFSNNWDFSAVNRTTELHFQQILAAMVGVALLMRVVVWFRRWWWRQWRVGSSEEGDGRGGATFSHPRYVDICNLCLYPNVSVTVSNPRYRDICNLFLYPNVSVSVSNPRYRDICNLFLYPTVSEHGNDALQNDIVQV